MRYMRILVAALFAVTLGIFGYYRFAIAASYDEVSPVIISDQDEITVSVTAKDEDLLKGLTASDDRDGDVTDSIIVEAHEKFSDKGKRKVSYAAFDKAGNVGSYSRTIYYEDYSSPKFELLSPLRVSGELYNMNPLAYINAQDCLDGNITKLIKYTMSETANFAAVKEAKDVLIAFQVTNSAGDTSALELNVEVLPEEDYAKPVPILSDYLVYTKVGEKLDTKSMVIGVGQYRQDYLFEDHEDEENPKYTAKMIKSSGKADYSTPGVYRIIYTLKTPGYGEDAEAVTQGSVSLYVVVEE